MRDQRQASTAERVPADRVRRIYERLVAAYGIPHWEPDGDALGGLVATILSQHTSDANSARAYAQLVAAFPRWDAVRHAPVEAVAAAIRCGGLANRKAAAIHRVLHALAAAHDGHLTLAHLADVPTEAALRELRALPGVGPKTAACVLLFALGRPVFPVDTHVLRLARRLGLLHPQSTAEAAHEVMAQLVPSVWRHTLHVLLIAHGRRVCHARRPACAMCVLVAECPTGQALAV